MGLSLVHMLKFMLPQFRKTRTDLGGGGTQAHNICEDYFCQVELKKGLTSQMTHQEGAGHVRKCKLLLSAENATYFSTDIKECLL